MTISETPKPVPTGELRKMLAAATKGPWTWLDCRPTQETDEGHWFATGPLHDPEDYDGECDDADKACQHAAEADAALIVAAVNALPSLLDELDALRAKVSRMHSEWMAMSERAEQAESSLSEMRKENERLRAAMLEACNLRTALALAPQPSPKEE